MINKLITIVIPMYNESLNIKNCLNNLMTQSYQNYHVNFVDDGSLDNTLEILEQYLEVLDTKFSYKIFKQSNSGAAAARKLGIEASVTSHIAILDCDDLISTDFIKEAVIAIMDDCDITMPNLKIQNTNQIGYQNFIFFTDEKIFSGLDGLKNSLGQWLVHGIICCKKEIFEKSYAEYSKYNVIGKNYLNNDEVITRLNFYYAKNIIRNNGTYYYQHNIESTTKRVNQNRYLMCENAMIMYRLFGKNLGQISLNAEKELVSTYWGTIIYFLKKKQKIENSKEWIDEIEKMQKFIRSESKFLNIPVKSKLQLLLSKFLLVGIKNIL